MSRQKETETESRPSRKRVADVQTEDLEENEQMDAKKVQRHPKAEGESSDGRMFIGNWEHGESETHNQRLEDKSCRRGITGPRRKYGHHDSEGARCTMGFHKRGDEESSVQEDANWRSQSTASWSRITQREKDDELHRARVHMQFVCRMYKLQHDEGRYFLH